MSTTSPRRTYLGRRTTRSKRFHRRVGLAVSFGLAMVGLAVLPWILAISPARHGIFRRFVSSFDGDVRVESAALGWFSPVSFHQATMTSPDGSVRVEIRRWRSEQPFRTIVAGGKDRGTMHVEQPSVTATMRLDAPEPASSKPIELIGGSAPTDALLSIENAALTLRGTRGPDEPVEWARIRDIEARVRLRQSADGAEEAELMEPFVLDDVEISPLLGEVGLQYVSPVFADMAAAEGRFDLRIDELRIDPQAFEKGSLAGRLNLEEIEITAKSPMVRTIADLIRRFLPDDPGRPTRMLVHGDVEFRLRDGGIASDRIAFSLPELLPGLEIHAMGWVGIDGRLEMAVEIPLPRELVARSPDLKELGLSSIRVPIAGTLEEPVLDLRRGATYTGEILDNVYDFFGSRSPEFRRTVRDLRRMGVPIDEPGRAESAESADPTWFDWAKRRILGESDEAPANRPFP